MCPSTMIPALSPDVSVTNIIEMENIHLSTNGLIELEANEEVVQIS